jgi:hypothetical protein
MINRYALDGQSSPDAVVRYVQLRKRVVNEGI